MDFNGDGHIDILSGSYSRKGGDMAGLFQVLAGDGAGDFSPPAVATGAGGQPLIVTSGSQRTDVICTRPFAADLDDDGHLDIITGTFSGSFHLFRGTGPGQYAPTSERLEVAAGASAPGGLSFDGPEVPLMVDKHSDPFLVDWDDDGDLDMLSGTAGGGVMLSLNGGTKRDPSFAAFWPLIRPNPIVGPGGALVHADSPMTEPFGSTRVWAADVDADGDLDLLVGDSVRVRTADDTSPGGFRQDFAGFVWFYERQ